MCDGHWLYCSYECSWWVLIIQHRLYNTFYIQHEINVSPMLTIHILSTISMPVAYTYICTFERSRQERWSPTGWQRSYNCCISNFLYMNGSVAWSDCLKYNILLMKTLLLRFTENIPCDLSCHVHFNAGTILRIQSILLCMYCKKMKYRDIGSFILLIVWLSFRVMWCGIIWSL